MKNQMKRNWRTKKTLIGDMNHVRNKKSCFSDMGYSNDRNKLKRLSLYSECIFTLLRRRRITNIQWGCIRQRMKDVEKSYEDRNRKWHLVVRNIVKKDNCEIINSEWVFKKKKNEKGLVIKYKARLIARGFKQKNPFLIFTVQ